MKKIIVTICMSLFMLVAGIFSGCGKEKIEYYIDYDSINNVVAYNSEISFDEIFITKLKGVEETKISITEDMVVSCDSTDSVGDKQLVVKYNNKKYTINFVVKYKVDFIVDDVVYDTQYVLDVDDIVLPLNPEKNGVEFVTWNPSIPQDIDDNMTLHAQFTVGSTGMQELMPYYNATYLDTLADIELPQNENGKWVFVDDLSTQVGNAGENYFQVKFVPNDKTLLPSQTKDLKVIVAKKELEFKNVVNLFSYDGKVKVPEYELDVEGLEVEYIPYYVSDAISSGEYEYEMEIIDENYCGLYYGMFTIEKVKATVVIESKTIKFSDEYPSSFVYEVLDKNEENIESDLLDLMGIKVIKPTYQHAGIYEINVEIENENFEVTVNKGYLTVNKVEHDLEGYDPIFEYGNNIAYSNKLETLVFANMDVRGTWAWKNPEIVVNKTGKFNAIAVFTPIETQDYLPSEKEVELNVTKKVLTIEILNNEFTYDKSEHTVLYQVNDVMEGEEVEVVGNVKVVNAGEYEIILSISSDDLRYVASTNTTLKINQASKSDFSKVYETEWNKVLVLDDIKLDEGYVWEDPMKHIDYIGTKKFFAIFTPDDTLNYKTEKKELAVTLTKAKADISVLENYEFTYSKDGYELYSISPSHEESELNYVYLYEGQEVEKINNAGNYSVTLTLPESEHYLKVTKTFIVKINKIENIDAVAENIDATYGETLSLYKLPTSETGVWVWEKGNSANVGNAGKCINIAKFTPNDVVNYSSRTVNVNFNIAKKMVEKPTISAKQFIEGTILTADVEETDEYIIFKNEGGENVGTYEVILELIDSDNYRWSGVDETAQTTLSFEITKNESNVWLEEPSINSFVYGQDRVRIIEGTPKFGKEYLSVIFTDKATGRMLINPTNVGDYFVKFYVEETENYNGLERILEFSIKYIQVATPIIEDLTYDGTELSAIVPESDDYTIVMNEAHIDTGLYEVVLELASANHKWADGTVGLQKTIGYKINKAVDNVWKTVPKIDNWVYTPNGGKAGVANSKYGSTIIKYKLKTANESEYSTELPVNVGAYVAKFVVEGNDNYNGLEQTIDFIISQATPTITAPTYDMTKAYFENNVDVSKCYLTAPLVDEISLKEAGNNFTFSNPILSTTIVDSTRKFEEVAFEITYNSASKNYMSVTTTATINIYKVAYIDTTYYGSIENALSNAVSGNLVYVIPNITGNVTIARDIKISSGVSLILPYLDPNGNIAINSDDKAKLNSNIIEELDTFANAFDSLKLTNLIYVKSGVTIENYGTIKIGGELSGGGTGATKSILDSMGITRTGIAGQTGRNYAKLLLGANSKLMLKNLSQTRVYGYIDEEIKNNGSQVIIENGAELHLPFLLHDLRGGTFMKGMKEDKNKISPFNQFEFRNVIPEIRVNYGGKIISHSNVHEKTFGENHHTEIKMVGSDSSFVIQLKENAYMIAKYDIDESTRISGTDRWADGVNYIKIYGGAIGNPIVLTVTVALVSVKLDTSTSNFPISWRFNISLYDGEYAISNKYKLLPGAVLYVDKSAKLTMDQFTVYEVFNDVISYCVLSGPEVTNYGYGKKLPPAKFIVNGHLVVKELSGKIITENDNAIIEVTTPKCLSYEAKAGYVEEKKLFGVTISKNYKITEYFITGETLELAYVKNGSELSKITVTNGGKYVSSNNTWTLV